MSEFDFDTNELAQLGALECSQGMVVAGMKHSLEQQLAMDRHPSQLAHNDWENLKVFMIPAQQRVQILETLQQYGFVDPDRAPSQWNFIHIPHLRMLLCNTTGTDGELSQLDERLLAEALARTACSTTANARLETGDNPKWGDTLLYNAFITLLTQRCLENTRPDQAADQELHAFRLYDAFHACRICFIPSRYVTYEQKETSSPPLGPIAAALEQVLPLSGDLQELLSAAHLDSRHLPDLVQDITTTFGRTLAGTLLGPEPMQGNSPGSMLTIYNTAQQILDQMIPDRQVEQLPFDDPGVVKQITSFTGTNTARDLTTFHLHPLFHSPELAIPADQREALVQLERCSAMLGQFHQMLAQHQGPFERIGGQSGITADILFTVLPRRLAIAIRGIGIQRVDSPESWTTNSETTVRHVLTNAGLATEQCAELEQLYLETRTNSPSENVDNLTNLVIQNAEDIGGYLLRILLYLKLLSQSLNHDFRDGLFPGEQTIDDYFGQVTSLVRLYNMTSQYGPQAIIAAGKQSMEVWNLQRILKAANYDLSPDRSGSLTKACRADARPLDILKTKQIRDWIGQFHDSLGIVIRQRLLDGVIDTQEIALLALMSDQSGLEAILTTLQRAYN